MSLGTLSGWPCWSPELWLVVVRVCPECPLLTAGCGMRGVLGVALFLSHFLTPGLPLRRLGGVKGGACAIAGATPSGALDAVETA